MTLDELIRSWFVQNKAIAGKMATYAGSPAVFLQTAPPDKQPGWGHESQYPRIVNTIELRADNERKSQGLLRVDLYCDLAKDSPEDIEPLIRSAMKDIVMQPDDSSPYCFAWARTDGFELESNNSDKRTDKRIAGYEVVFDIIEYPEQYATYPDPCETMNLGLKEAFPDLFVIGVDQIDRFRVATEDEPILYIRTDSISNDHVSMALTWVNCTLAIHVIAPTASSRNKWVRCITNALMMCGEAAMPDESPLRFTDISATNRSDYLLTGQITLKGQYTLPRIVTEGGTLRNIPQIRRSLNNGN